MCVCVVYEDICPSILFFIFDNLLLNFFSVVNLSFKIQYVMMLYVFETYMKFTLDILKETFPLNVVFLSTLHVDPNHYS